MSIVDDLDQGLIEPVELTCSCTSCVTDTCMVRRKGSVDRCSCAPCEELMYCKFQGGTHDLLIRKLEDVLKSEPSKIAKLNNELDEKQIIKVEHDDLNKGKVNEESVAIHDPYDDIFEDNDIVKTVKERDINIQNLKDEIFKNSFIHNNVLQGKLASPPKQVIVNDNKVNTEAIFDEYPSMKESENEFKVIKEINSQGTLDGLSFVSFSEMELIHKPSNCFKTHIQSCSVTLPTGNAEIVNPCTSVDVKHMSTETKLTVDDILDKIKEAYKACSCKICKCITGNSFLENAHPKSNPFSIDMWKQLTTENNCDSSKCKTGNKDAFKEVKKPVCKCNTCDCIKCADTLANTCRCQRCQCIECKSLAITKMNTVVVASVEEHTQNPSCQCSPCDCMTCRNTFIGMPGTTNNLASNPNRDCQCDSCDNEACVSENNNTCLCVSTHKLMQKPKQKDVKDFDIHRLSLSNVIEIPNANKVNRNDKLTMYVNVPSPAIWSTNTIGRNDKIEYKPNSSKSMDVLGKEKNKTKLSKCKTPKKYQYYNICDVCVSRINAIKFCEHRRLDNAILSENVCERFRSNQGNNSKFVPKRDESEALAQKNITKESKNVKSNVKLNVSKSKNGNKSKETFPKQKNPLKGHDKKMSDDTKEGTFRKLHTSLQTKSTLCDILDQTKSNITCSLNPSCIIETSDPDLNTLSLNNDTMVNFNINFEDGIAFEEGNFILFEEIDPTVNQQFDADCPGSCQYYGECRCIDCNCITEEDAESDSIPKQGYRPTYLNSNIQNNRKITENKEKRLVDTDYHFKKDSSNVVVKKIEKILEDTRAFSMNLLLILEKYERANKNFRNQTLDTLCFKKEPPVADTNSDIKKDVDPVVHETSNKESECNFKDEPIKIIPKDNQAINTEEAKKLEHQTNTDEINKPILIEAQTSVHVNKQVDKKEGSEDNSEDLSNLPNNLEMAEGTTSMDRSANQSLDAAQSILTELSSNKVKKAWPLLNKNMCLKDLVIKRQKDIVIPCLDVKRGSNDESGRCCSSPINGNEIDSHHPVQMRSDSQNLQEKRAVEQTRDCSPIRKHKLSLNPREQELDETPVRDIPEERPSKIGLTKELFVPKRLFQEMSLKVEHLNVQHVVDDLVLVRWSIPKMIEHVAGYELLVDGKRVTKINSPTRCVAFLRKLPLNEKVLVSVRTIVTGNISLRYYPTNNVVFSFTQSMVKPALPIPSNGCFV